MDNVLSPALVYLCVASSTSLFRLQVEWTAMNDGDVYILDTRSIIYVWVGRNSNNIEKLQGAKVGVGLRGRHGPGEGCTTLRPSISAINNANPVTI